MKLCIPTTSAEGLEAPVSGHFGRAPFFTFVDTVTGETETVANPGHGAGHPPDFVLARSPDAVAVRGLGQGAYSRLAAGGVEILRTEEPDVKGTIAATRAGRLRPLSLDDLHSGGHHRGHE